MSCRLQEEKKRMSGEGNCSHTCFVEAFNNSFLSSASLNMFIGKKLMVFSFIVNSHSRGKYLLVLDTFSIQFGTKTI